jgi:hypothetical protein
MPERFLSSGSVADVEPVSDSEGGVLGPLGELFFFFVLLLFCSISEILDKNLSVISLNFSVQSRFRIVTNNDGSNGRLWENSLKPKKYWRYGFSCIVGITSSSGRRSLCLMITAPMARRELKAGRAILLVREREYIDDISCHGKQLANTTQRLLLSSPRSKGVLNSSKLS